MVKKDFRTIRKEKGFSSSFVANKLGLPDWKFRDRERNPWRFTNNEIATLLILYDVNYEEIDFKN